MLKNIRNLSKTLFQKVRSLYREKVEDTVKEWEEVDEPRTTPQMSRFIIVVTAPWYQRLWFVVTGQLKYRLTRSQMNVVRYSDL